MTLFDTYLGKQNCIRLNFGTNKSEIQNAKITGHLYGYIIDLYRSIDSFIELAVTGNYARVVHEVPNQIVHPGQ